MPDSQIVTLTTDFGEGSRYVAAMKGVLLSLNPRLTIVDISHAVPPQDIRAADRVLVETTPWFPDGTLHVAVVDPGVGSEREILYAEVGEQRYICPDNGLLTSLAARQTPRKMIFLREEAYRLKNVRNTFHGRDIMAPAAAHLSLAVPAERLGQMASQLKLLELPRTSRVGQSIEGEIVEVDSFGNLITNISAEQLANVPSEDVTVCCDDHQTTGIFKTYAEQPPMTLVAVIGSGDHLEIAIVDDSAKIMLGVAVGTPVTVQW